MAKKRLLLWGKVLGLKFDTHCANILYGEVCKRWKLLCFCGSCKMMKIDIPDFLDSVNLNVPDLIEEPTLFCNDSVMLMHNTRSCSIDFQWLKKSKNDQDQPCPLGFCSNAVSCPIPNKLCHKQNVIVFTIFTSKWKVVLSSFFSADLSHGRHHISHFLWLVLCTHKTSLVSSFLSLLPCSILHGVSENHRHISYQILTHDSCKFCTVSEIFANAKCIVKQVKFEFIW